MTAAAPVALPEPVVRGFLGRFLRARGLAPDRTGLAGLRPDGSLRLFWRIRPPEGPSFILMANPPAEAAARRENLAYLKIGQHLRSRGLPVPEILRFDLKSGCFILEDLGETSLQQAVGRRHDPLPLYREVVSLLFRLQTEGAVGFDPAWCCQTRRYDRTVMRRLEADYFRDAFLGRCLGLEGPWDRLEGPFDHLVECASAADSAFFLHRDFQSRNILVSGERIGILDWQGGRLGPLGYDLAGLAIDPYVDLPAAQREGILRLYLDLLGDRHPAWVAPFERSFPYLAILRNLQILGAYGFLATVRGKSWFRAYIPRALASLQKLLEHQADPALAPLLEVVGNLTIRDPA